MPFTFSHPSVVIPFLNKRFTSATGLVIGSMTPDFEYFIRMKLEGIHGHTWAGIFYFDLPVGLLLIVTWILLIKDPLMQNLPHAVSGRLTDHAQLKLPAHVKGWLILALSIMAGAFTHVLWDSVTHNNTVFTRSIPFLKQQLFFFGEDYPLYHMLQHVSTGVGFAIVATLLFVQPLHSTVLKRSPAFWPVMIGITTVLAALRFGFMQHEIKIGHVVVILIAAGMYSLILTAAIFYRRYR